MPHRVRIRLEPLGETIECERGAALQDILFERGLEFPCGGLGRCRGCRVRVLEGTLAPSPDDRAILSSAEIAAGLRLACRARAECDLVLDVGLWEASILSDDAAFPFEPQGGLGAAVDLGTTTLVAQLIELSSARVLGVRTALNPQARHGADVMSRIQLALEPGGLATLSAIVRREVGSMLASLLALAPAAAAKPLRRVAVVGNTPMRHLFCGIDPAPLARVPFEPESLGPDLFRPADLGWDLPAGCEVRFLPGLGGFVGSDVLAGILATGLHESAGSSALVDLGTNGEVVVGDRTGLLCASTAAGPAFEGARISMGMRAATGAVHRVRIAAPGRIVSDVLGGGPPRGICGSGLVDAAAAALDLGILRPDGRFADGRSEWLLAPPVAVTQSDIRELQLAKGAIAAGFRILLERRGWKASGLARCHLAGAFGNAVAPSSAVRIGLFDLPETSIRPAGNAALRGAKISLFRPDLLADGFAALRRIVRHVGLSEDPDFLDAFAEAMRFP